MPNRTEAAQRKPSHVPPGGYSYCACSRLHIKRELHKKDNPRVVGAAPVQWFGEGWRWTRGYAAPRALGESRGRNWRGIAGTGKST